MSGYEGTLPGDISLARPFLRQQLSVQAVSDFLYCCCPLILWTSCGTTGQQLMSFRSQPSHRDPLAS
eukprot:857289-Pelagomonas_calceolata.AAC.1